MPRPMIRIHNIEIDEVIDREMTAAEFEIYKANLVKQEELKAEAEAKATAKAALLNRLGITVEEAVLLLS